MDHEKTPLYTRTKKRVDDFYESIRDKKLDSWLFINVKGVEVKVVKHNGDVIKYNGVLFTGAPRTVFWDDDFIPPFIAFFPSDAAPMSAVCSIFLFMRGKVCIKFITPEKLPF